MLAKLDKVELRACLETQKRPTILHFTSRIFNFYPVKIKYVECKM